MKSGAPAAPRLRPAISSTTSSKSARPRSKPAAAPTPPPSASRVLKADLDDVFKVFVDVLQNPEFRADKIDIAQKEEQDGISRRNDQVGEIAHRESVKLAYGADNPYARVPEYATVAAVTRQDLIDWHGKYVHPNNIILGISGDFDSAAMEARLRAAFDSWPKGPTLPKNDIKYNPAKPGYYLVPKDDVNQSTIHMVALGTTRDNPDYYAIAVFNEAFGGGFSSRLFNDIRTKRGLAYSVGGGIGSNFGHPGILQVSIGTKSQSTFEAIQAASDDIDGLAKQPITDDEIQKRQRRHPQRLHLPSRLARQNSRRAHDLRILRIPARLARQVSGGSRRRSPPLMSIA